MKKFSLLLALVAVAFTSCLKDNVNPDNNKFAEISLTASIDGLTRSTYTDGTDGIKMTWDAEEKISIVKCEVNGGKIVGVYNLSSTGAEGRENAVFTGTVDMTGSAQYKYLAVYPAVEGSGTSWGNYGKFPNGDTTGNDPINQMNFAESIGYTTFITSTFTDTPQDMSNPLNHLKQYDLMYGTVTMNGSTANTTLTKYTSIFKFVLTFPEQEGGTADEIKTFTISANNSNTYLYKNAWFRTDYDTFNSNNHQSSRSMILNGAAAYKIPSTNRTVTLYMPVTGDVTFYANDVITLQCKDSGNEVIFEGTKDVGTSDRVCEAGKVHTITATLTRK
ncbi:MAG: hypothetical protein IJA24_05200 [Alistipes sp.]|nr:hypothetical protein [Alistipes sp.]